MGKGRDKRKKHEDPAKQAARLAKQAAKVAKHEARVERKDVADPSAPAAMSGGFNGEEAIEVTLTRLRKADAKRKAVVEHANCPPPTPRANCAVAAHPTRENEIVIFGGEFWNGEVTTAYNDLYVFNIAKHQWSQIVSPVCPPPRSSVQVVAYKHNLIFQGGEFVSQTQSQFLHFRDTWRYDTNTGVWEEFKCRNGPSARSGHRLVLWKRSAVLFAGFYDNALETKYYNDLWILSDLEGAGEWRQVLFSPHAEQPEPRSGHSMGLHENTLFVYGGYSTQKFNRFKKSEATVHHDLWSIDLAAKMPTWTKIKLAGIPPPIRSGVSSTFKDKRLFLFGGVVDIDAPGGKTMSSFHNDLFVFHMDTQRFFPAVLQASKAAAKHRDPAAPTAAAAAPAPPVGEAGASLAKELAALGVRPPSHSATAAAGHDDDDESDDDDDDEDEDEDEEAISSRFFGALSSSATGERATKFRTTTTSILKERQRLTAEAIEAAGAQPPSSTAAVAAKAAAKTSAEHLSTGQVMPCPRMDANLCIMGNSLIVVGGQFEVGKKEVTLMDGFALNLNRMATYQPLFVQDLDKYEWVGRDSEPSEGSWEDGSTVASFTSQLERMQEIEDEEDGEGDEEEEEKRSASSTGSESDQAVDADGEVIPKAVPFAAVANADGRTTVKGKGGMKAHKAQLQAQLGDAALVPTPHLEESLKEFYTRTERFWHHSAVDACGGDVAAGAPIPAKLKKRIREDAMLFCRLRYEEAIDLLAQLKEIDERQQEEERQLREQLRERRARLAAEAEEEAREAEETPEEEMSN